VVVSNSTKEALIWLAAVTRTKEELRTMFGGKAFSPKVPHITIPIAGVGQPQSGRAATAELLSKEKQTDDFGLSVLPFIDITAAGTEADEVTMPDGELYKEATLRFFRKVSLGDSTSVGNLEKKLEVLLSGTNPKVKKVTIVFPAYANPAATGDDEFGEINFTRLAIVIPCSINAARLAGMGDGPKQLACLAKLGAIRAVANPKLDIY
jgi:hypothetical protein